MGTRDYNSPKTDSVNMTRVGISRDYSGMELEPPLDGSTVQHPPNGGLRAWLIVLSCTGINALLAGGLFVLSKCIAAMPKNSNIPLDTLQEIIQIYNALAAVVMIIRGYRVTVVIGACLLMSAFISLSYLEDNEGLFKFLIYGPVAIGASFIGFGGLIPVMEYFTTKRMAALFLSRLGLVIGSIVPVVIDIKMPGKIEAKWRYTLRGSAGICVCIGLLGMTLKELKLTMRDDESATFVQRTFGLFKKDILKNKLFRFTCIVYFFYQWGIETPKAELSTSLFRLDMGDSLSKILTYALCPFVGLALGTFLAWLFNKIAFEEKSRFYIQNLEDKRLYIIFGILAASTVLSSIGCFIAPDQLNFDYFTTFHLLFSTFSAFCEGVRDSSVPEVFGRGNTKIVEGFIIMSTGIGGIITNEIGGTMNNEEDDNDWKKKFRYGGGMLLVSSVVTIAVYVAVKYKALHANIPGHSDVPSRPFNNRRVGNSRNSKERGATSGVHNRGFELQQMSNEPYIYYTGYNIHN